MQVNSFVVNVASEQPERLFAFYRDTVGLPVAEGFGGTSFSVGGSIYSVVSHSEVHGRAREPERVMLNFFVDDIAGEQERLDAQGVEFIRRQGKEFWGGLISTFLDPDGNYCQLIEYKEEAVAAQ